MTIDIFVKSYSKDYPFLLYLLRSIQKNVTGYRDVVIVVPEQDKPIIESFNLTKERVHYVKEHGNPYIFQQRVKLNADCYTEADTICFVDSDCFFFRPYNLQEELFRDGKPILMITPYSDLPPNVPWKPITERTVGFEVQHETMRRLPLTYRAEHLDRFRRHIAHIHGKSLNDYIDSVTEFSEFNAIGSYILKYHPNEVSILDTSKDPIPEQWVYQAWSWGGLLPEIVSKYERLLT